MLKRKINAAVSLLTTVLLLSHAILLSVYMLTGGRSFRPAGFMGWALMGAMIIHALISIDLALSAHIGISVMGVLVLGAYTSLTKKSWKLPVLEILMCVCYGVALICGIVIMNVPGIAAIVIAHKVAACVFAALLIVLFAHKLISAKKA